MFKNIKIFFFLVCSVSVYAQTFPVAPFEKAGKSFNQDFWQQVDDIFNDPNFVGANWGVVIRSLETGEYLYKRNENKLFMPASCLKIFTTISGLEILGKDYRFKTNVFLNGTLDGSILQGDVIVQGFGDPTISDRFYNGDLFYVFNSWADSLAKLGIDEINGNLIGDDNAFDDNGLAPGWAWDDESYWYSAPTGALSFSDNCVGISVRPSQNGLPAMISVSPESRYVTILNKVNTVESNIESDVNVFRERGTNIITVYGRIGENSEEKKVYATINNPTQFMMVVLKEVLQQKGIKVNGYAADIDEELINPDYNGMVKLLTYYSPSLSEIVKVINKNSQNFYAEQLLKTIGYEKEGFGSIENGIHVIKNFFGEIGINPEMMIMVDGSGLSRLNLITPKQMTDLLTYIYSKDNFKVFYESLPVAGVDGTLARRMRKTKAENNVRAKTGYISGVRSLCGYVYSADNEPLIFSVFVNNYIVPSALADNLQDLLCLRLANFTRK